MTGAELTSSESRRCEEVFARIDRNGNKLLEPAEVFAAHGGDVAGYLSNLKTGAISKQIGDQEWKACARQIKISHGSSRLVFFLSSVYPSFSGLPPEKTERPPLAVSCGV